ncbi:MAG: hypothetical protein INR62_01785 [Rhodospirillales bacterium]|nr:hypothetical protein [Acetobacter sp.]
MSESKRKPPTPARPPEPNYSINQAKQMVGKTVESVEVGFREDHPKLHQSELIVLHFTDGTTLAIDTGSNVGNVIPGALKRPDEIHVDFNLEWFQKDS